MLMMRLTGKQLLRELFNRGFWRYKRYCLVDQTIVPQTPRRARQEIRMRHIFADHLHHLRPHSPKAYYRTAISSFFLVMGLIFASWASRIPDVKQHLGLSDAQLGGVLFAAPLGQVLSIAFSAWLIERCGSRNVVILSMILFGSSLVSLGLAPSTVLLFAALFSFGFTDNMLNISLNSQAVGVETLYGRSIMATFHGMWSLGGLAGGILGAVLAPLGVKPLVHFCLVFALSLAVLAGLRRWTLPRDVRLGKKRDAATDKPSYRPDLYLILLGFIAFGSMATEGAMYDWSSVYFAQVIRPGEELIRLGYVACMTAMVIGRFVADRLVSRYGVTPVLQLSGCCIAGGMALALLLPRLEAATAGLALVGFGMASVVPLCYSLAGKSRKVPTSVAISLVSSLSFLGFLACPPMVGFLSHLLDLRWALAPIVGAGAAIVCLAPVLRRLHA